MKKSFLFVAALALTFAACQPKYDVEDKTVATFEEAAVTPADLDTVYVLNANGTFESGNFVFQQEVSDYTAMGMGIYYSGSVVSNKKGATYDFYADSYKSAAGGAQSGKNFVVWTSSYTGFDAVKLKNATVVPGMYVCNTAWVAEAVKNGVVMCSGRGALGEDDYFRLTIAVSLEGQPAGTPVEFYLAKGKNAVNQWTYVDLSTLGKVDELHFALSGTKTNQYGLTTPAYFCIDNLGASK